MFGSEANEGPSKDWTRAYRLKIGKILMWKRVEKIESQSIPESMMESYHIGPRLTTAYVLEAKL